MTKLCLFVEYNIDLALKCQSIYFITLTELRRKLLDYCDKGRNILDKL